MLKVKTNLFNYFKNVCLNRTYSENKHFKLVQKYLFYTHTHLNVNLKKSFRFGYL